MTLATPEAGRRVGKYRLERELGRGGMSVVWAARDTVLGRDVALKLIPAEVADDPKRRKRLLREAQSLARLDDSGIARVLDYGEDGDAVFLAMDIVPGELLSKRLEAGPLTLEEASEVVRSLARSLAVAHEAGIVHRDLKPSNVMLKPDGEPVLLDFGIARVTLPEERDRTTTADGQVLGTPAYMSPEQIRGIRVDARSDVFSLGALLYELISGERPFERASEADSVLALLTGEPPALPAKTPRKLRDITERCLQKDSAKRYADATDLLAALEAPARKRYGRWLVVAAVAFASIGGGVAWAALRDGETSKVASSEVSSASLETLRQLAAMEGELGLNDLVAFSTTGVRLEVAANSPTVVTLRPLSGEPTRLDWPHPVVGLASTLEGRFLVFETVEDRVGVVRVDPTDGSRSEWWSFRPRGRLTHFSASANGETVAALSAADAQRIHIYRRDGRQFTQMSSVSPGAISLALSPSGERLAWFELAVGKTPNGTVQVVSIEGGEKWTVPDALHPNMLGSGFVGFADDSTVLYALRNDWNDPTSAIWSRRLEPNGRLSDPKRVAEALQGSVVFQRLVGRHFIARRIAKTLRAVVAELGDGSLGDPVTVPIPNQPRPSLAWLGASIVYVREDGKIERINGGEREVIGEAPVPSELLLVQPAFVQSLEHRSQELVLHESHHAKKNSKVVLSRQDTTTVRCSTRGCIRIFDAPHGIALSWITGPKTGTEIASIPSKVQGALYVELDLSGKTVVVPMGSTVAIVDTESGAVRRSSPAGLWLQQTGYDLSRDNFVVTGMRGRQFIVARLERDGSARVVGVLDGYASAPRVSPDGKRLAFILHEFDVALAVLAAP